MLGFDYTIVYEKGKDNLVADALSRMNEKEEGECAGILISKCSWKEDLRQSQINDPVVVEVKTESCIRGNSDEGYAVKDGLLFKGGRYYVGSNGDLRTRIVQTLHDSGEGEHSGVLATTKRVETHFFWPGMKSDVQNWVKDCEVCQRNKGEHVPTPGLLQAFPVKRGKQFRWILWKGCRGPMVRILS